MKREMQRWRMKKNRLDHDRMCRANRCDLERLSQYITQHIPDKNFQLVRCYGWSSNKMRGQRNLQRQVPQSPEK